MNLTETSLLGKVDALEKRIKELEAQKKEKKISLIAHSGEFDKIMSVLILATGAATLGYKVDIFFTFWGLNALKKGKSYKGKSFLEKLFTLLQPAGLNSLPLSHFNFMGAGIFFLNKIMKKKGVASLDELFDLCRELKVNLLACDMTCNIMNINRDELIDGLQYCGVITFFNSALKSEITLFI